MQYSEKLRAFTEEMSGQGPQLDEDAWPHKKKNHFASVVYRTGGSNSWYLRGTMWAALARDERPGHNNKRISPWLMMHLPNVAGISEDKANDDRQFCSVQLWLKWGNAASWRTHILCCKWQTTRSCSNVIWIDYGAAGLRQFAPLRT